MVKRSKWGGHGSSGNYRTGFTYFFWHQAIDKTARTTRMPAPMWATAGVVFSWVHPREGARIQKKTTRGFNTHQENPPGG